MENLNPATITAIRTMMGLSQAELATMLDVSRETVNAWEKGKSRPHRHGLPQAFLNLEAEHTHQLEAILANPTPDGAYVIPGGPEPFGWRKGLAARVRTLEPLALIRWQEHGEA